MYVFVYLCCHLGLCILFFRCVLAPVPSSLSPPPPYLQPLWLCWTGTRLRMPSAPSTTALSEDAWSTSHFSRPTPCSASPICRTPSPRSSLRSWCACTETSSATSWCTVSWAATPKGMALSNTWRRTPLRGPAQSCWVDHWYVRASVNKSILTHSDFYQTERNNTGALNSLNAFEKPRTIHLSFLFMHRSPKYTPKRRYCTYFTLISDGRSLDPGSYFIF